MGSTATNPFDDTLAQVSGTPKTQQNVAPPSNGNPFDDTLASVTQPTDQTITMQPLEGEPVDVSGLSQQQVNDTRSAEQKMGGVALGTIGAVTGASALPEIGLGPLVEHISGRILEHGTELVTKYPNFVKLVTKMAPGVPFSTVAALTYAYEHFKK